MSAVRFRTVAPKKSLVYYNFRFPFAVKSFKSPLSRKAYDHWRYLDDHLWVGLSMVSLRAVEILSTVPSWAQAFYFKGLTALLYPLALIICSRLNIPVV
jgi:hypothetical protein